MNKSLQRFFVILLLASPVILAALFWKTATPAPRTGIESLGESFRYDISALREVDPKLIIASETASIPLDLAGPVALTLTPHQHLAIAGTDEIVVINPDTRAVTTRFKITGAAQCVATDADGRFYVGFRDHIATFDPTGQPVANWPVIPNQPIITSVAVAADNVYVADAGNKVVHHYNRDGALQRQIGQRDRDRNFPGLLIPTPYLDIAIGPNNALWVVDPGRYALLNIGPDGRVASSWSKNEMTLAGFVGCSNPTHIAITSQNQFVTSEKGVPRVKLYNITGALLGVIAAPALFADDTRGLDLAVDKDDRIIVLDPEKKLIRIFTINPDKFET